MSRLQLALVAGSLIVGMSGVFYYGAALKRNMDALQVERLADFLGKEFSRHGVSRERYYLYQQYFAKLRDVRSRFLSGHGYWKNIHVQLFVTAYSYYLEGDYKNTLLLLKKSIDYHPYFLNAFKMAAIVFKEIGLTQRQKVCEDIYDSLLSGRKLRIDAWEDCLI